MRPSARSLPWGALALLVLLPPLVCAPLLAGLATNDPELWTSLLATPQPGPDLLMRGMPGWGDGNAGVTTEALGGLAASDWLHGRVPWWNPYSGVGLPLAAEGQNSAFFLPFVLLLALPNGLLLLKLAMQVVAGLATFGLARRLALGRPAALACGILAEFNGSFAWYAHGPIMPIAFLPLLLLGIETCRTSRTGPPVVAVAIAMSLLAGFPETAYLDGLLAAIWAGLRIGQDRARMRLAGRIALGGICGLLLASPFVSAFLRSLPVSYLGPHADYDSGHLLHGNLLMLLAPYAFGPILWADELGLDGPELWWHAGGYLGLPLAFAALVGLGGPRERALRIAIGAWLAATAAKACGWRPAVAAFDHIPFVRQAMFHVYILPSWEIGAIVLAGLALEDWRAAPARRGARVGAALVLGGMLALGVAWSRTLLLRLGTQAHDVAWASWVPSAVELALFAATIALAAARAARARRLVLLPMLAACVLDFAFPLLSSSRPRPIDLAALDWLRAHLGEARFTSIDVIQPNTGARYRVASVNAITLPVPQNWVDALHAWLDPSMDPVQFFGEDLRATNAGATPLEATLHPARTTAQAEAALAGLAVRYVVVPHGAEPFADTLGPPVDVAHRTPVALADGVRLDARLASPRLQGALVTRVGVLVGTYRGAAGGRLLATICGAGRCATARGEVAGATDNALLWMTLDGPVPLGATAALTLGLQAEGPANRPAVWTAPCTDGSCTRSPIFAVGLRDAAGLAPPVYADRRLDIHRLPGARPYVESEARHCRLASDRRDRVIADCAAPDTLVRRELFYPGWQARIDGRRAEIRPLDGVLQTVALPAGRSVVTFAYRPPGAIAAWVACGLGLLLLAGLVRRAWAFPPHPP